VRERKRDEGMMEGVDNITLLITQGHTLPLTRAVGRQVIELLQEGDGTSEVGSVVHLEQSRKTILHTGNKQKKQDNNRTEALYHSHYHYHKLVKRR
jgi:hypothetical protein